LTKETRHQQKRVKANLPTERKKFAGKAQITKVLRRSVTTLQILFCQAIFNSITDIKKNSTDKYYLVMNLFVPLQGYLAAF
jgi:hypothetical protein